jgi:hypothetical protein
MKKFLTLFLAIFASLIVLSACGTKNVVTTTIDDSTAVIVVADSSVMEISEKTTFKDYLDALKTKGDIDFEGYESSYGFYITSINGTAESTTDKTYWAVFVDFTQLDNDSTIYATDYQTVTYKDKTLYSASYGVSGLPCVEGHTYAFVLSTY